MKPYLFLLLILVFSCKKKTGNVNSNEEYDKIEKTSNSISEPNTEEKINEDIVNDEKYKYDTIKVDINEIKDVLNIWSSFSLDSLFVKDDFCYGALLEGKVEVDFILRNSYFLYKRYLGLQEINKNSIRYSYSEGGWNFFIYKVEENNFIIFIKCIQYFFYSNAYEYSNGKIKKIEIESLLGNYIDLFKKNNSDKECEDEAHQETFYDINFYIENTNTLKISIPTGNNEEDKKCYTGNLAIYKFIPEKKIFKLDSLIWKTRK